jgi:hypothetical protein
VAPWAEVLGNCTISGEEPLGLPCRLERFLTKDDHCAVLRVVSPDGRSIHLAPIDGDLLRHSKTSDGFGQRGRGRPLVALLGEQKIDGLARLVHRAVEIPPLPLTLTYVSSMRQLIHTSRLRR